MGTGTAASFNRMLHGELNAYAAWLPIANTFQLGDYGLISDGVFTPMGNIAEYGVGFVAEEGSPASLDFSSDGTSLVRLVGNGEVKAFPNAPLDAKLAIRFARETSFLAKAAKITTREIRNLHQVAASLARARGWERRFRVVWTTYTGHDCVVVTTRSANASFELSGSASALAKFELGAIDAAVTVSHEENVGFKSLGKTGVLALRLFKLKLWGAGPKLLAPEDESAFETEGPASLEDDV